MREGGGRSRFGGHLFNPQRADLVEGTGRMSRAWCPGGGCGISPWAQCNTVRNWQHSSGRRRAKLKVNEAAGARDVIASRAPILPFFAYTKRMFSSLVGVGTAQDSDRRPWQWPAIHIDLNGWAPSAADLFELANKHRDRQPSMQTPAPMAEPAPSQTHLNIHASDVQYHVASIE